MIDTDKIKNNSTAMQGRMTARGENLYPALMITT